MGLVQPAVAASPYDDFDNAFEFAFPAPGPVGLDLSGGTPDATDPAPSCRPYGLSDNSTWLKVTPTQGGLVQLLLRNIHGYAGMDTSVWTGDSPANLTEISCNANVFAAEPGVTYWVLVLNGFGDLEVSLLPVTRPANDDISDAEVVSGELPVHLDVNLHYATVDSDDPVSSCATGPAPSVWFVFTAPSDMVLWAYGAATLWTGAPGALEEMACGFDVNNGVDVPAGTVVYLEAREYYSLDVYGGTRPPNDSIDRAEPIRGEYPLVVPYSTALATVDPADPPSGQSCSSAQPSVWFVHTPTRTARVRLTQADGNVEIYRGAPGQLTQVACHGDLVSPGVVLQDSTTYYLAVTGSSGTFTLDAEEIPEPPVLGVAPTAQLVRGKPTVRGTLACAAAGQVSIAGELRQRHGAKVRTGRFDVVVQCDGDETWRAPVDTKGFTQGSAWVVARATQCQAECLTSEVRTKIRLTAGRH